MSMYRAARGWERGLLSLDGHIPEHVFEASVWGQVFINPSVFPFLALCLSVPVFGIKELEKWTF